MRFVSGNKAGFRSFHTIHILIKRIRVNWLLMQFGVKSQLSPSTKIMFTISFPMWRLRSTCTTRKIKKKSIKNDSPKLLLFIIIHHIGNMLKNVRFYFDCGEWNEKNRSLDLNTIWIEHFHSSWTEEQPKYEREFPLQLMINRKTYVWMKEL